MSGVGRSLKFVLLLVSICALPLDARRKRYSKKALLARQQELQRKFANLPEDAFSQSLVERTQAVAMVDSGEPVSISAIVGIVFAIISIVTTIWDLWEKWNAIIMLKYAMSEMKHSNWSTLQKYQKYSEISFCVRDRVNEAVDTMNVVATYFKMLHYAETQCSRPDVHLDWLATSKRCTRDFAIERIQEMHTEICSAQYGEGLFSTVEMLEDDSAVTPSMAACSCLDDNLCEAKKWCRVAENSTCPDRAWHIASGYYSYIPCEVKGMADKDKARMLLKSTCTVCNHGFFRNAGVIESNFYAGILDPALKGKDIKDAQIRGAIKMRYTNCTVSSCSRAPDMNVIEDDTHTSVEEKAYLAVMKWERLIAFDKKCNDFKASISTKERTQMTGEDLANEKINRLAVDGRLGKLGTDMEWQAEKIGNLFAKKGAEAFDHVEGSASSLLEVEDFREVRDSVNRLQSRRSPDAQATSPNLDKCSDYKMLSQNTDDLKAMAADSSDVMAASQCAAIEGATSRESAWRRFGVSCKCQAFSTSVFCGKYRVAGRKFKLSEVSEKVAEKQCKARLYCSKFPKTEEQINFLVKSRLGCSTVRGAEDKATNSAPECKCSSSHHMLFCGDENYGRGNSFHLYDDVLNNRKCFENARCALPEDPASLEMMNTANEENQACSEVFGAKPRESLLAGNLESEDCKCGYGEELFCGKKRMRGRHFNKMEVLHEGCSRILYCAARGKADDQVWKMMRASAKPMPDKDVSADDERITAASAGLIQLRSSSERMADVLLWVPVQLARVLKVTTQGIVDWGQAIWWFGFNNLYGAYGTIEAYGLLAKAAELWDKFALWTGIITFFIWLVNDAIFVGMNSAMCPKLADWIEIMDGVRADAGAAGNRGNNTRVASDQYVYGSKGVRVDESKAETRQWCDTKLEDVKAALQNELIERIVILRQLIELQQEGKPNDSEVGVLDFLKTDREELELQVKALSWTEGIKGAGLELSRTHEKVTKFLKERLAPAAICPVAQQVMQVNWKDELELRRIVERRIQDNACRCDPAPKECGEVEIPALDPISETID